MDISLNELNDKLNAIMEHLGVKKVSEKEYMDMPEEEKDAVDEESMKESKKE